MNTKRFQLPRATPQSQGIEPAAIANFIRAIADNNLELHSLIVARHGHVVAEGWWKPFCADKPHMLYSLSKSFCSTAVGMAVADGLFSIDERIVELFPEDSPAEIGQNLAGMRVRDLLCMASGHGEDTTPGLRASADGNWARAFLAQPVPYAPGTHFLYNSGATYMLSALVQKKTGMRVVDYLRPRLFDPLGIGAVEWQTCPRGIDCGGWGLSVTTEDIAKFGQLYLNMGLSPASGERLIDESWIMQATAKQVSNGSDPNNDWNQGYGFQFWRCRHNVYRGDGAFGQYCIVMPEHDAVIAITSGVSDLGAVLRHVWTELLPEMKDRSLHESPDQVAKLTEQLSDFGIAIPTGRPDSPLAAEVSKKTYRFTPRGALDFESIRFCFESDRAKMSAVDAKHSAEITAGYSDWIETPASESNGARLLYGIDSDVAARAVWTAPDRLVMTVSLNLTPFAMTIAARFAGERVFVGMRSNVGFGRTEWAETEAVAVDV